MTTLWQDLRYGLRVLARSPGFTAVAILTLALGIGANTAIFTVVYGVLLRPLPFPHPDRIVALAESYKQQTDELRLTSRQLKRLQDYKDAFEHIAGSASVGYNLAVGNSADHLRGMPVSDSYFRVLGVQPFLGRDFTAEDDSGDGQRVAIIAYSLWSRRFGAEPSQIGRKILLNGEPYTLIGVMPRGFSAISSSGPLPDSAAPEIWTPLAVVAGVGNGSNISVLARLKPNVTPAQLQAQMNIVTQDFRREYPNRIGKELVISFLPYQRMIGADIRPYLLVLLGSIGFVLLIACANVANLFLARSGLRAREIAVRIAMGASGSRLFQQLITESMLVALAGGALGLLVAYLGLGSLLAVAPVDLPRASDVHLDVWIFAFTFVVSLLTGVLFGLAPALEASRTSINEVLKEGVGRASAAPGRARLRQVLVVGELAISLVLLTGAGLMIATFSRLLHTNPGFNSHRVLTAQFWLIGSKYDSSARIENFNRAIVQRIESLPGVDAAAIVAAGLPLEFGGNVAAALPNAPDHAYSIDYREITPGFFRAMGIPLRQGRVLSDSDSETSSKVAIVNEALARELFSGRNPLGERILLENDSCEIVGVVGDVKSNLDEPAPPTTFVPAAQASYSTSKLFEGWFPRSVVIRSSVDPLSLSRSVRDAIAAVDPVVPTGSMRSMDQVLSRSLALRSFMMFLLSLFAALALILASVGIYGVISYAVSQRTREIGVRMALGAHPADVLRLILGEGLKLVLVGVVLGILAALAMTRFLTTMIYGVSATDPLIFGSVITVLIAVSLAACYVPARRAMRVDPIIALRYE